MPPVCPDLSPTQIAKERMGLIETFQCIICIQTAKSTHLCPKVRTLKRPNETFSPIIRLRVVQIQAILFLKSMSEKGGTDIERLSI